MKQNWFDLKWSEYKQIDSLKDIEKMQMLMGEDINTLSLKEAKQKIDNAYWTEPIPTVSPMYIRLNNGEIVTPVSLSTLTVAEYEDATNYLKENNMAGVMSVLYRPFKMSFFNKTKLQYYLAKAEKVKSNPTAFTAALKKVYSLPKEIETYDYEKTDKRISLFDELPVPYVHSASLFFCLVSIQLSQSILPSLAKEVEAKMV